MGDVSRLIEPWIIAGESVEGLPDGPQTSQGVHWRAWRHEGQWLIVFANLEPRERTVLLPRPGEPRAAGPELRWKTGSVKTGFGGDGVTLRLGPTASGVLIGPLP